MFNSLSLAAVLLFLGSLCGAHAQALSPLDKAKALQGALTMRSGVITLPGGKATLNLPAGFHYLDPADTARVLTELWGNAPSPASLGMIVPADTVLISDDGWGVHISYEADGHVRDDEADNIAYDELLKEAQEAVLAANPERKQLGYPDLALVGWAEKPSYDKLSHKMYWAKEFSSKGDDAHSLNYSIRVLGREGVLVLNAIARMDRIVRVRQEMKKVTAFTDFTPGNRYADFNTATDKTASYGLAALVAGGVAGKLGLFAKLFALVLALKKVLIIGLGVAATAIWGFFRGKSKKVNLEK